MTSSKPAPVVELDEVCKQFPDGTQALGGVTLHVSHGETVALVGESGSGKTTLLRSINRLVDPTSGQVRVQGNRVDAGDPIELRRHIGYVPQNGGLLPHWTVEDNVGLVPKLLGWKSDKRNARTRELLELVGLAPATYAARYPKTLSGGQRQRVALARALASDPELVLLDEPFGALDPLTRRGIHDEFLNWKSQLDKTLILVTHDMEEALRLSDRVAVLRTGKLEQVATTDELCSRPANEYVRGILGRHWVGA